MSSAGAPSRSILTSSFHSVRRPILLAAALTFLTSGLAAAQAINAKYSALGGPTGWLGTPVGPEMPASGGGRYREYQHGTICWHPNTGAHEIHGLIREKWVRMGREHGPGYPTTDETTTADRVGRYNDLSNNTSIYWTPQLGAHEVHGYIRGKWLEMGRETSYLGYPTSDEQPSGNGRVSHFQGGRIEWTSSGGARAIRNQVQPVPIGAVHPIPTNVIPAGPMKGVHSIPTNTGSPVTTPVAGQPAPGGGGATHQGFELRPSGALAAGYKVIGVNNKSRYEGASSSGSVRVQPGEFIIRSVAADSVRVGQGMRYRLPVVAVTVNAVGDTFSLQPILQLVSPGLEPKADGSGFSADILLGVDDLAKPEENRPLPRQIWALLRSAAVTVRPPQVPIGHTNRPLESATASGQPEQDAVDIQLDMLDTVLTQHIPVLRGRIELKGPSTADGFGADQVPIMVSLTAGSGPAERSVNLRAEKGLIVPGMVTISGTKSAEVEYRPSGLGLDSVQASAPGLAGMNLPVKLGFPWVFLLTSFVGSGLGAVILQLFRPKRTKALLARYFLGGVLAGLLVACLYLLRVNVTWVHFSFQHTPVAFFAISALGAISAIPLVRLWSGQVPEPGKGGEAS